MGVDAWSVAQAKAKFSEVIDKARSLGPQTITRNGRKAVVIVAAQEWERKTKRNGNLAEFFAASPLRGSSRRTEIRVSPRSRTLASSPCSAGWSVSSPKMTVSSPSPLTCRPSNQAAHRLSRTLATRISYRAGPPEAATLAP